MAAENVHADCRGVFEGRGRILHFSKMKSQPFIHFSKTACNNFGESQHEQLHSFGFFANEHHPEHGSFPHQFPLLSLEIGIGNCRHSRKRSQGILPHDL